MTSTLLQDQSGSQEKPSGGGFHRRVLQTFVVTIIVAIVSFLNNVMLNRLLGPTGRGDVAAMTALGVQGATLGTLGLDFALMHFWASRRFPPRQSFWCSILSSVAVGLALVALIGVFGRYIGVSFLANPRYAFITGVFLFAYLVHIIGLAALLACQETAGWAIAKLIWAGSWLVGLVIVLLVMHRGAYAAVTVFTLGCVLAVGVSVAILYAKGHVRGGPTFNWHIARQMISYGLKGHIGTLMQTISLRFDLIVVYSYCGKREAGYYAVASAVAECIWLLPCAISSVLIPRVAVRNSVDSGEMTALYSRLSLLATAAAGLLIGVAAPLAVWVTAGSEFSSSITPLRMLIPGVVASAIWRVMTSDFSGRGCPGYKSLTSTMAALTIVVLLVLLLPVLGVAGAAIASSAAYIAAAVTSLYCFRHVTGIGVSRCVIPTREDLARCLAKVRSRWLK